MNKHAALLLLLPLTACATRPAPAPQAPSPPAPAAPRAPEPPGFSGLSPEALRARLGAPAFARKDGPTDMWRYDAGGCHAFFFFTGGAVAHVETLPGGAGGSADASCLSALKKTS